MKSYTFDTKAVILTIVVSEKDQELFVESVIYQKSNTEDRQDAVEFVNVYTGDGNEI